MDMAVANQWIDTGQLSYRWHGQAHMEFRCVALAGIGDDWAAHEQWILELTHLARARLLRSGVFPASRPELVAQLEGIGAKQLATKLRRALARIDGEGE